MNKTKAVIFDLDGTLCELGDSVNPYNHDGEEVIIPGMDTLVNGLDTPHQLVIILTGRKKDEYEHITEWWLEYNEIYYDRLIMQEGSTAEKNHIYKKKKLGELKEEYDILFMVDDNPDMIPVCKELGITLLHVNR